MRILHFAAVRLPTARPGALYAVAVTGTQLFDCPADVPDEAQELAADRRNDLAGVLRLSIMIDDEMQLFDIVPLDPRWTLPSRLVENPLVWMIPGKGVIVDMDGAARTARAGLRSGIDSLRAGSAWEG